MVEEKCRPLATQNNAPHGREAVPRVERSFDRWLQKQLHDMYDVVAQEPLPDDLMALIDRRGEREAGKQLALKVAAGKALSDQAGRRRQE